MLCFNFSLCLVLAPEVACFCFMMRLIVLSTVANLSTFLPPVVTSKGQLCMAWNSISQLQPPLPLSSTDAATLAC